MLSLCALAAVLAVQPPAIVDGTTMVAMGVHIHYLQSGPATSSRALVLIPGWRLPSYLWTEQLHTFGKTTRVIAVDPRSQGPSTKTTEGNSPETRAKDLHALLANLHISHAVLVGWSQGAQDVAAYVAQFGTDGIDGVVFVDSPVSIGPAEVDEHRPFAKIILSGIPVYENHPDQYSRGMIQSLFRQPHPDLDMDRILQSTLQTPTDIGITMLVMDIFGADRLAPLKTMHVPALVIASSTSPLLDEQREMAAAIPGARFVPIEGTGHAVFVDQPAQFDSTLKPLVESH